MSLTRELVIFLAAIIGLATHAQGAQDQKLNATTAMLDVVQMDNLIVQGSECIGMDCVDGEVFGSDTLRFKENNIRIHFEDTSTTEEFPSTDWRILINEQNDGGANVFGIENADTDTRILSLEGDAPANSLFVSSEGNVGLGTEGPTEKLHVVGNAVVIGSLEVGGSRDTKQGIEGLELEQALSALEALEPVQYQHTHSPGRQALGFIGEEVPELVASSSGEGVDLSNIVAVLTKVVQEQQRIIEGLL